MVNEYLEAAKSAIDTLQSKWWNTLSQRWEGIQPWQSCVIADALLNYTLLSEDLSYTGVIEAAVWNKSGLSGNDDDLWSAIAALKFFYLTGDYRFYERFTPYEYEQITKKYWDSNTCGGGVFWDYKKTYKNAITNELWIFFLTLLARATGNSEYLTESPYGAIKACEWFLGSGMLNEESLINDGLTIEDGGSKCINNDEPTWTYNQGVILAALVNLQQETSVPRPWSRYAKEIAEAVSQSAILTNEGVLREPATSLSQSQESFKGIYVRNCAYLAVALPGMGNLATLITANAKAVKEGAVDSQGRINAYWDQSGNAHGAAAQASGIDLFTAAARVTIDATPQVWSFTRMMSDALTSESLRACEFNGRLHAAWRGVQEDGAIYWSSMGASGGWSEQQKIGGGTDQSPALAVFGGKLYAAWKGWGSDGAIYWSSMGASGGWSEQQKIGGGTDQSPALAVFGGKLYAAWKGWGSDGAIYWSSMGASGGWSEQQKIGGGTDRGPTLAMFDGKLYAAWKGWGSDGAIYWSSMGASGGWSEQQKIGGGTDRGPTLAMFDGKLYAAWKGWGTDTAIWFSWLNQDGHWLPQTRFVVAGATKRSPTLAAYDRYLYLFYAANPQGGYDNRIWYARFPDQPGF